MAPLRLNSNCGLLALPENIILGWKRMVVTNTLAYYDTIIVVISLINSKGSLVRVYETIYNCNFGGVPYSRRLACYSQGTPT